MIRLFTLLLLLSLSACAEGTIVFGGDRDDETDTIVISGAIDDITPQNAVADIVVFVFTDLEGAPDSPDKTFAKQRSAIVAADSSDFRIDKIRSGDLTVVFLQDKSEPDGTIDEGDPFAMLEDPDDRLESVRNGQKITIVEVDIDFSTGEAMATDIRSERESQ